MKVKELAGKINIRYTHRTMFRFADCRSHDYISNRISIHNAFNYWGNFSVVTYFVLYDSDSNVILIDVFIDPNERRIDNEQ